MTFLPSHGFTIYWNRNDSPLTCFRPENSSPIDSSKPREFHDAKFLQPSSIHNKTQVTLLLFVNSYCHTFFSLDAWLLCDQQSLLHALFSRTLLYSDKNFKTSKQSRSISERSTLKCCFIAFKMQQTAHATS